VGFLNNIENYMVMKMKKKVLIIGIDGLRPDAMLVAKTPNLDKLAANGTFCWKASTEIQTVSGPAWSALLTGVHSDKHMVVSNDFSPRDKKYESIFQTIKKFNSDYRTVGHSNWKPIITEIFEKGSLDIKSSGSDKKMAFRISKDIEKDKGDIYFIQLDEVDGAGHSHTYSPDSLNYLKVIEKTDEYVGSMLQSIEKRPNDEEWLILTVSDHGGSGKSHGIPNMDCLTIVFIVSGSMVQEKGEIIFDEEEDEPPFIVDMVPTIAKFLNIPLKPEWDGIPRGI
jgi:predicted AlkP superfamily pyrophosphatase or phosphodiesterase